MYTMSDPPPVELIRNPQFLGRYIIIVLTVKSKVYGVFNWVAK